MATNELTEINMDGAANGTVQHFIDTSTQEGKMKLYSALQDSEKLDEHLNEPLDVVNVIAQRVAVANEESGEMNESARVIIVTEDGTSYSATSPTLLSAFNTLFGIFGTPDTWAEPMKLKVIEGKSRKGYRFFNLVPAEVDKKKKR